VSELRKRRLLPLLPTEGELRQFEWPLEKKAYGLLCILLPLCPFWWLIDKREPYCPNASPQRKRELEYEWNQRRANWVLGWLAVLIAVWLIGPESQPWKLIVGVLAALRLLEVFVTGLGTILDQGQQIRARNVVTVLIYAVQAMLIFAILYHSFVEAGFENHPHRPSDFLYISWSAVVSLGNEHFAPTTTAARFLEVAAATTAIFLLTVLFAYAIDTVKTGEEKKETLKEPCEDPCGPEPKPYPRLSLLLDYLGKAKRLRRERWRKRNC